MARSKSDASLDEQIEKAQDRLAKAKAQYDSAAAELRKLLEERDARRQKLLMAAIAKSDKSFEDILRFLESKSSDHDN
jgi:flagellar biosynthesis chaperone FliJ